MESRSKENGKTSRRREKKNEMGMKMRVYYCDVCRNEVWARHNSSVSCRCGKVVEMVAEGELFTLKGKEYLQITLPLEA